MPRAADDIAERRSADPLYLSDAEIARRVGVGEDTWRSAVRALERERAGFPPRDRLFGGKRYWPAVKAALDAHNGIMPASAAGGFAPDGQENWS